MTGTSPKQQEQQQENNHKYEFGGPVGAFLTTMLLPPLVLILSHWTEVGFVDVSSLVQWSTLQPILFPPYDVTIYLYCTLGLVLWFGFLVALWIILPGSVVQGSVVTQAAMTTRTTKTTNDLRLPYKLNAHMTFWVIMGMVAAQPPLYLLYRYFHPLAWSANLLTFGLSCYFYLGSFGNGTTKKILSTLGNTGNIPYDFWMGRELNPRLALPHSLTTLELDWKQFCELRPGLIGWMLVNLGCAQEQYHRTGSVSPSMILLNLAQAFYVWDGLYQDQAILTTMDITTDGFGFMLCFGDMSWVPFTYTVPAKYLVNHDPHLSWPILILIVVLYALGFYIFRSANGQKDVFRRDPNHPSVSKLTYLSTKRGTRLLTAGWWGYARKINYTGDWLMGMTYSLLCGFDSLVPYYYAVYFAILLIHRSTRDDELCHSKYGDDWLEYKRQVPYRFIPGIW
jgi:hypothetical protein